jgi:hypothetical protein
MFKIDIQLITHSMSENAPGGSRELLGQSRKLIVKLPGALGATPPILFSIIYVRYVSCF